MEATMRHGGVGIDTPGPILELKSITKRFGAVDALSGVDFDVYPSEVVALAGDNGAGKSTLVKIIAGTHEPDTGVIRFDGAEVKIHSPRQATHLGIETVYQDLALCDNLDVVANMFLGRETVLPPRALRRLSELEMERHALEVLRRLKVTTIRSVRAPVSSLSGGQRQSVPISRAVMGNSKIVLLDEPTATLGVAQTHQVLELIKRLRSRDWATCSFLTICMTCSKCRTGSSCYALAAAWRLSIGWPRRLKTWSLRLPAPAKKAEGEESGPAGRPSGPGGGARRRESRAVQACARSHAASQDRRAWRAARGGWPRVDLVIF